MEDQKPGWKVKPRLRSNARTLRKSSKDAERLLWSALRGHCLNGFAFRRQVPIANYIADFVCHAAKLVVEVDGGQHYSDASERTDTRRSAVIEAQGFRVLRSSNLDVLSNRVGVLETIVAALAAQAPTQPSPASGRGGALRLMQFIIHRDLHDPTLLNRHDPHQRR